MHGGVVCRACPPPWALGHRPCAVGALSLVLPCPDFRRKTLRSWWGAWPSAAAGVLAVVTVLSRWRFEPRLAIVLQWVCTRTVVLCWREVCPEPSLALPCPGSG